jgi:hypothetical protein
MVQLTNQHCCDRHSRSGCCQQPVAKRCCRSLVQLLSAVFNTSLAMWIACRPLLLLCHTCCCCCFSHAQHAQCVQQSPLMRCQALISGYGLLQWGGFDIDGCVCTMSACANRLEGLVGCNPKPLFVLVPIDTTLERQPVVTMYPTPCPTTVLESFMKPMLA